MGVHEAQLEQDDDGRWSARIGALPGCAAWGFSQEEALAALQDAALAYIEDKHETDSVTDVPGAPPAYIAILTVEG